MTTESHATVKSTPATHRLSGVISTSESNTFFNYIFLEIWSEPEIDLIHEKNRRPKIRANVILKGCLLTSKLDIIVNPISEVDGREHFSLKKSSAPLSLMTIYRMSLISAGSISLDSTCKLLHFCLSLSYKMNKNNLCLMKYFLKALKIVENPH